MSFNPDRTATLARPYRFFGAFRFLLALLVAIQHFGGSLVSEPWRRFMAPLAPGNVAVMVFFVLSGFIIFEARASFYDHRPGAFLLNRSLRIVPSFIAAVLLSILVQAALLRFWPQGGPQNVPASDMAYTPANLAVNLLGFMPGVQKILGEPAYEFFAYAWSIRVEFGFYLVVFAVIGLSVLMKRLQWPLSFHQLMAAVAVVVTVIFIAYRTGKLPWGGNYTQYIPYFVFGGAVYTAYAGHRVAGWIAAATLPLLFWHFYFYEDVWFTLGRNTFFQLGLLAALLLAAVALPGVRAGRTLRAWDQRLGDLSYPLYLNHPLIGAVLGYSAEPHGPWMGVLGLALAVLLATMMHRLVEPIVGRVRTAVRGVEVAA